ncbi:MAG TPA: hypothetical protein VJ724_14040 [Tahibacter sp.]|nr:hypothetical protein [Tahibacter sp.]
MTETSSYAVYLFPQALEALGDPVKPYVQQGPGGEHIVCAEIDVSGPLFGLTLSGRDAQGRESELEIMIPHSMVKLVMSIHSEHGFGFKHA